jgi:hypothetical protein
LRYANALYERAPDLLDELIHLKPDVLMTRGGPVTAAAKRATASIPIVIPMRPEDTLGVPCDRLLHPERRIARSQGMILVGQGRSEEGHDPVAHHLVNGALVVMDGFHHSLEHWIEDLSRFLGIAVGKKLHRSLEVGEENGHLLTLALEGCPGRQNPLG